MAEAPSAGEETAGTALEPRQEAGSEPVTGAGPAGEPSPGAPVGEPSPGAPAAQPAAGPSPGEGVPELEPGARTPEPEPRPVEPAGPAISIGRAIADAFAGAGARFAFTVPGETFLPLIDGLLGAGVRVVATRHEGAASFMAEAAAQLTGRPQLVLGTRAVGAANAAIGIHTARQDSASLVAIFGQVHRNLRGKEAFQEADIASTIGGLAPWSAEAHDAGEAVRLVAEGLRRLGRGRPGPIVLALPEDVLDEPLKGSVPEIHGVASGPAADRMAVRQVLRWLAASERGVILAGGGVLRARASKRLMALSEALAVPVIASWRRPDVFPNDHPHYLGMTGYWAAPTVHQRLLDADVMLVLGCRLSEISSFGYTIPGPRTRWAHVDLEPRTGGAGLHAPSLAVPGDAARFLDACWSDLRGAALDAEMRTLREHGIEADRAAWLEASRVDTAPWDGPGVHPGRIVATMQRLLPPDALIATDAGNFGGWAARGYRFVRPGTFLGPTSGAMGYGLPAAIAASLVRPDRPAIAICGDGGFAMTMNELETAVRERAHPIAIVFDNGEYGTIRMHQVRDGRELAGTLLGSIDFAAVARACGALGFTVDTDEEFAPALEQALAARAPAVIHLRVDPRWVSVDEVPSGT